VGIKGRTGTFAAFPDMLNFVGEGVYVVPEECRETCKTDKLSYNVII
jgi:hypothetical protein